MPKKKKGITIHKGTWIGLIWGILAVPIRFVIGMSCSSSASAYSEWWCDNVIIKLIYLPASTKDYLPFEIRHAITITRDGFIEYIILSLLAGAILGTIIGLLIDKLRSILGSSLENWKKGAILGGVWGILSILTSFFYRNAASGWIPSVLTIMDYVLSIIFLPATIFTILWNSLTNYGMNYPDGAVLIALPLVIVIGIILGALLGKVYDWDWT